MPLSDLQTIIEPMQRRRKSRFKTSTDFQTAQPTPEVSAPKEEKGFLEKAGAGIKEGIQSAGKGIVEAGFAGQEKLRESQEALERGEQTGLETTFQQAGAFAGTGAKVVGSSVVGGLKAISPKVVEEIPATAIKGLGEFGTALWAGLTRSGEGVEPREEIKQEAVQNISDTMDAIETFKKDNPRFAKNLDAVAGFLEAGLEAAGVSPAKRLASETAQITKRAVKEVPKATKEVISAQRLKNITKLEEEAKDITGKIIQGTKKDKEFAQSAIRNIDAEGIKTADDLSNAFTDKIKTLSNEVSDYLDNVSPEKLSLDDFSKVSKSGDVEIKSNFVKDSLDQLEELYEKINQPDDLVRIKNLKNVSDNEGLTIKEVNDIAREYNVDFGDKAFSKRTGEQLTSVNAKKHENTRKSIKNSVREKLPDDTAKTLDSEMSSLFTAKRQINKLAEDANKLKQKYEDRGLLKRAGGFAAETFDVLSGRIISGFLQRLVVPRSGGLKLLNAVELEKDIAKNLKKFNKIRDKIDKMSDKEALNEIKKITQ
jgi:hypothetical protein